MKIIEEANLEQEILLEENISYYYKVRFTHDSLGYSWIAYAHQNNWRACFPMKNTNYVKFFKTISGAKRNFIKHGLRKDN